MTTFTAAILVRVEGGNIWSWLRSSVVFRVPANSYVAAVGIPLGATVTVGIVGAAWHAPLFWLHPTYDVLAATTAGVALALGAMHGRQLGRSTDAAPPHDSTSPPIATNDGRA